jgi:hypothetical protein
MGVLSEGQNVDLNKISTNANKSEDTINRAIADSIKNRMFESSKR